MKESVDWIDHPIVTRSTFAIGQSAVIAERTGITTVGDLRVRPIVVLAEALEVGIGADGRPECDEVPVAGFDRGTAVGPVEGVRHRQPSIGFGRRNQLVECVHRPRR